MCSTCYVDELKNRAYKTLSRKVITYFGDKIFDAKKTRHQKIQAKISEPKVPFRIKQSRLSHAEVPSWTGMNLLFRIFNLFCSLHFYSSIGKASSIIPIHSMRKSLDSFVFFFSISLNFCISKLFEHIILSRLLFFLESFSNFQPYTRSTVVDGL